MNPKLIFLLELCKLIGRLGTAAANHDTQSFLNLVESVRRLCDQVTANLRVRIIDVDSIEQDDEL